MAPGSLVRVAAAAAVVGFLTVSLWPVSGGVARADARDVLIVCLGDSLTEGYGLAPEHAYPSLVERRLRVAGWSGVEVVNAGISGATSASGLSRLQWQLRRKPDVLVLALGANDGLRGVDLASTRKNLADTIDLALANDIEVVLAGMKLPPNYGSDYTAAFERLFPELAAAKDVALIPFLLSGVAARADLNLPDGIHPNAKGYEIVAETVTRALLPVLEGLEPSVPADRNAA